MLGNPITLKYAMRGKKVEISAGEREPLPTFEIKQREKATTTES
jgi:hypothetical protein